MSLDTISARYETNIRLGKRAIAFGCVMYAVFCIRAGLSPELLLPLFSLKRLIVVSFGAALFWAVLHQFERNPRLSKSFTLQLVAHAVAASALVFMVRRYAGVWTAEIVPMGEDARWSLVWAGYFTAAVALHMAKTPGRILVEPKAEPTALADPPARSVATVLSEENIRAWEWMLDALVEEMAKAPDGATDKLLNELNRRAGIRGDTHSVAGVSAHLARQSLLDQLRARMIRPNDKEAVDD